MGSINPFRPGPGIEPPHLAGRKKERQLIEEGLDLITRPLAEGRLREAPLAPIKLLGLRGVGKTTLLGFALMKAKQQGIHVISYSHLSDVKPGYGYDRLTQSIPQEYETARSVREQEHEDDFSMLLEQLVRAKPVLLLLDEAMHYETHLLKLLLQETEQLIRDGLPLAVIMAGTPMLDGALKRADASFIDRALNCHFHHLSDDEVRTALREPFTQRGVPVSEDALDLLASWTDNYPYYVQLAGDKAWDAMEDAERFKLDMEMAQQAEPAMRGARDNHYRWTLERIEDARLLDHADHAMALIESADHDLRPEQLRRQLAEAVGLEQERCQEVFDQLLDLGVVWTTDDDKVIAGMPSFYGFVKTIKQRAEA